MLPRFRLATVLLYWFHYYVGGYVLTPPTQGRRRTNIMAETAASVQEYKPCATDERDVTSRSLAGSYLVECSRPSDKASSSSCAPCGCWSLLPLEDLVLTLEQQETYPSKGARAWAALQTAIEEPQQSPSSIVLRADFLQDDGLLRVSASCSSVESYDADTTLVAVLSRMIAQWTLRSAIPAISKNSKGKPLTIHFPSETETVTVSPFDLEQLRTTATDWNALDSTSNNLIQRLFADLNPSRSEIVEMVDVQGSCMGYVPRLLMHQHNLLHRGIGMFVTKDRPIQQTDSNEQPDVYCHRRTDDKRIFPSLYDMFVGGVSLANEASTVTARREVAEELGLVTALKGLEDQQQQQPCPQLSERLLQCVVCTGYNRCVVDLFSYTMDSSKETVKWQVEEVAWGSFVPFATVEAAADRSIRRLVENGAWPGRNPPLQSSRKGEYEDDAVILLKDETVKQWKTWDFVPDGLLVWEAWLEAVASSAT